YRTESAAQAAARGKTNAPPPQRARSPRSHAREIGSPRNLATRIRRYASCITRGRVLERTLPCLRIIVVEDQGDIREMLADALERRGYTVTAVSNGRDAVDYILRAPPDVAIVDIGLPELNGYEVARAVRARLPTLRLVALTGYGQVKDRQAAF